MWNICFPLRFDRREDDLDEGGACFFALLNPTGGLYGWGPEMAILTAHSLVESYLTQKSASYFLSSPSSFISLELSESLSESESEDEPESEVSSSLDSSAFTGFLRLFSCLVLGAGEAELLELLSLSDAMAAI